MKHQSHRVRRSVAALAVTLAGGASALGLASATAAHAATTTTAAASSTTYTFSTVNNHADPTFNQLLGINDSGLIAGYYGSGAAGHPNRGYRVASPYGQANFANENVPHAAQTQVTGLNNTGDHGRVLGQW